MSRNCQTRVSGGSNIKTPSRIVRALDEAELKQCAVEALYWRRKGVLSGSHLRALASRLVEEVGIEDAESVRLADILVIEESAFRFSVDQKAEGVGMSSKGAGCGPDHCR